MVGLLAAVFAIVLGWVPEGKFDVMHGLLLCTSSVLTAGIASFVLGTIFSGNRPELPYFLFEEFFRLLSGFSTFICLS